MLRHVYEQRQCNAYLNYGLCVWAVWVRGVCGYVGDRVRACCLVVLDASCAASCAGHSASALWVEQPMQKNTHFSGVLDLL